MVKHITVLERLPVVCGVSLDEGTGVYRFPIRKSLWDLWDFLERLGVKSVWINEYEPSSDPEHTEIHVVGDEAELRVPEVALSVERIVELLELFAEAYTGHHMDWEETIREDYELWLEHLKRIWIEHGLPPEEAERRKEEYLRALEDRIKEEARMMGVYSEFAKSLFELMYPRKRKKRV
jgi:hypothetical protein